MRYLLLLFISTCLNIPAFTGQQWAMEPDDRLPVASDIINGRFENGLIYIIKSNKKPENRAELRLVVNAGSVLENEDQQGLAHFTEHMAFNGTKNFAKHELIDYLESIGMKFGPEINAYTDFDETVYMLQVPTDSIEIMEKAFRILQDWASGISFEDGEIDKERGVIIEEWRLGRGANARMRDIQYPIIFKNSRYAERLPIGKKEIVEFCKYETLRQFYRDWYRPDLMAVIAVGDFDVEWIRGQIEKHFAGLESPMQSRKRTVFPVPGHEETLFAIASDPEATGTSLSVYYKLDLEQEVTVADYRRNLVENIYNAMLNQRLYELLKQSDPPFLGAGSDKGRFVRSKEVYFLGANVKDGGIPRGLEALLTEARRVKMYGFTQSELERVIKDVMRGMERAYKERDKTQSRIYASEYTRHFLTDEPIPGIEYEYAFYEKFLPGIQLDEINQLAGRWISENNRVIVISAPEKPDVPVPGEKDLLAVFEAVETKQITPYVDTVSDEPLVKNLPEAGKINSEKVLQQLGVTELTLSNGITIILKPTDFKNDEIRFRAFSPGGHSLVSDSLYVAASTAVSVVTEGGIGEFNDIELEKKLAGTVARVSPYIGTYYEGLTGSASPQDMETMFQLIYLYMTAPRKDSTAFVSYQT
ncbi:insulinase family protein, partial [candidate division KSB1 bacterium]|nr:insulinase family protein [candidate division KSB1 bacterium]